MSTARSLWADEVHHLSATMPGAKKIVAWLDRENKAAVKAHETAIKVEGFRLKNLLQAEIRKGSPGGRTFAPLSFISRRLAVSVKVAGGKTRRQNPNRSPLERMAHGIRYNVQTIPDFKFMVGFVQPTRGSARVSKSWRWLASITQRGFTRDITPALRQWIIRRGGNLGKIENGNTPFFLKKSTRKFTTPGRPIVAPFWAAQANRAKINIRNNFKAKMAGNRI